MDVTQGVDYLSNMAEGGGYGVTQTMHTEIPDILDIS